MIPPEKKKVIDKLQLKGEFGLSQAKFTDAGVQTKLMGLSRRGQGMGKDEESGDVLSNLRGRFAVENAAVHFPEPHVLRAWRGGRASRPLRHARRDD